ncbi:putative hydrolase [Thauera sp. 27]|uniref:alpha/beta fold hydrolase n=1 Tax=Thauera sp. 27 TaxID=305700 RepID=UPI0002CFB38B|nr:alpha/beta hydrolase [Thauera sp. 27]ENO81120.1 putative hydrolase [Thauera sp. 27]
MTMLKRSVACTLIVILLLIAGLIVVLQDRRAEAAAGTRIVIGGPAGDLVYHRLGQGEAVVLLPSFARSAADFNQLAQALADAGYRSLAIQPQGIEGSAFGSLDVSLADYAADIAAVLDAEGVATAHAVVGHAYGNRVARVFAVNHPERVRKLVLLAAGGGKPPPPDINAAIRKAVFGFDGAARDAAIALAFFAGETVPAAWVKGWYPLAALHQTRATTAQSYSSWSHGGSAPMLILQPADDTAAAPADSEKLATQLGERATRHVIANAGHALLPEQAEAVALHILRYLDTPEER